MQRGQEPARALPCSRFWRVGWKLHGRRISMAMYEGRQRRNGSLRAQADHVREDISALQKDMSQLRSDFGELVSLQWRTIGDRVEGSAAYVGDQVKTRPLA